MKYFYIKDKSNTVLTADLPKFANLKVPDGCPSCGFVPSSLRPPTELKVVGESKRIKAALANTIWGFCIFNRRFLDEAYVHLEIELKIGALKSSSPQIATEYVSACARSLMIIRGGIKSRHRICNLCQALRYTAWPSQSHYVTTASIAEGRPIYEVEGESFLVREDIVARFSESWGSVVGFLEMNVLDVPLDGLPSNLVVNPSTQQILEYRSLIREVR